MKVRYLGPSPARQIHGVGRVGRGEAIQVPDELGRGLIKSASWEEVKSADPKPSPKPKEE